MPWSATAYFEKLTATNIFAATHKSHFCRVSGAYGLEELLASLLSHTAFVAVSDTAAGYTEIHNSPHTRQTKTIFVAMRHPIDKLRQYVLFP